MCKCTSELRSMLTTYICHRAMFFWHYFLFFVPFLGFLMTGEVDCEIIGFENDKSGSVFQSNSSAAVDVRAGNKCPCPPLQYDQTHDNICILGECVRCAKYEESCQRISTDVEEGLCCPTKGKEHVDCFGSSLGDNDRSLGQCKEDPCKGRSLMSRVKLTNYVRKVDRCSTSYGKDYRLYDYRCVGETCTKCGFTNARCETDNDCCSDAFKCSKSKKCVRKCGDLYYDCKDSKTKCCDGLQCRKLKSSSKLADVYGCSP